MEYQGYNDPNTDQGPELEPTTDLQGNPIQAEPVQGGEQSQNSQPIENQFDPTQFKLNYRGEIIVPKDKDHLINLAQQGHSYSQNMEKLNNRQRELDQMQNEFGQYKELDQVLKENPSLNQKIQQIWQEHLNGGANDYQGNSDDETLNHPIINKLHQEVSELQKWKNQAINTEADRELEKSINNLKEKYNEQPWGKDTGEGTLEQRIVKHAYENGIDNVELAYKDLMWNSIQANAQAEALRKQKEKAQLDNQNGIIDGGAQGTQQNSGNNLQYNPHEDYGDISRRAVNFLGG